LSTWLKPQRDWLRGDGDDFTFSSRRGGLDRVPGGKMLTQPVVNAILLAGVDDSLPTDIACPFIILSDYILGGGQHGNRAISPEPATKIRVVDNSAVFHIPSL
jgi:hypothetical protein